MKKMEQLVLTWTEDLRARGRLPRGVKDYERELRRFLQSKPEITSVKEITPERIDRFQRERGKTCAPRTIGCSLSVIRNFCLWLVRNHHLKTDPSVNVVYPKQTRSLPRAVKQAELSLLLLRLRNVPEDANFLWYRNRRIILIMLYSGLRRSEVANLCWHNVDMEQKFLIVRKGKNGKDRTVPLHPSLVAEFETTPESKRKPANAVAGREDGHPLSPMSVAHVFERWLPKVVPEIRISAHQLRHTFATQLVRHDANVFQVQQLLGHESPKTTQRYVDLCAEQIRDAVNLLPNFE